MKKSLLRRFRWPIFVAVFSSAHVAGIAYLYGDSETAMYGFVAFFIAAGVAVVLNGIDESPKTIAEKYETNYGIENNQNTEQ